MSKENPLLQYDMFSSELVDTRSDAQKKKDKERDTPQQTPVFKTPDIVQVSGKTKSPYREWLDKSTAPPLVLQTVETRTAEEIECDLAREVEKLMTPLFTAETPPNNEQSTATANDSSSVPHPHSGVIFDAGQHYCRRGLRAKLRAQNVPLRCRT